MKPIDEQQRSRYFAELSIALRRLGLNTQPPENGLLPVTKGGAPVCLVSGGGGTRYRPENMKSNAREETYEAVELFGKPALFTDNLINRGTVPNGLYVYDLRGADRDPGRPATVEPYAAVNHAGTVLTASSVKLPQKSQCRPLKDGLNFLGEMKTLMEYCKEQNIALPPEPKFKLRPASLSEAGLFYALPPEKDLELGAIGHIRMLDRTSASPAEYARNEIGFLLDGGPDAELLSQYVSLHAYGQALLTRQNAALTPYGVVNRDDNQPMQAPFEQPAQSGMEMM